MATTPADDRNTRYPHAKDRLAQHPYGPIHREVELLRTVLGGVFLPNAQELRGLLDRAATDTTLAVELVQNDHPPVIGDRFNDSVQQRLHNYLAAEYSLVQHVHIIANDRAKKLPYGKGTLASTWAAQKAASPPPLEYDFMKDLRRYSQHQSLPLTLSNLSWTRDADNATKWSHGVLLDTLELRKWSGEKGWTAGPRAMLRQHETIDLRSVVIADFTYTVNLNVWFYNALTEAVQPLLDEFNELQAELEVVVSNSSLEEARRTLKARADALSYSTPRPWRAEAPGSQSES